MAEQSAGILLLAAGSSKRFGGDKRQAKLSSGTTLLDTALANASASGLPIMVCLNPADHVLADSLTAGGYNVQICHSASRGMGSTLAEGVSHVAGWRSVLVALADMAWVAPATYRMVAEHTDADTICVPYYKARRGHPVGFGHSLYPQLAKLDGDQGAQALLRHSPEKVKKLTVSDPGILLDADTPGDLALADQP